MMDDLGMSRLAEFLDVVKLTRNHGVGSVKLQDLSCSALGAPGDLVPDNKSAPPEVIFPRVEN